MKKQNNICLILILFITFIFINATSYAQNINNNLENNIFRLHIIANSNSIEDQNLKLKVRDAIIPYINNLCKNKNSKSEIISICKNNLSEINEIATKVVQTNNYSYSVNSEIGNFNFPTKHYANISFPSGSYDALKITIGNANGQNWWCSLFPPLCFNENSTGKISENDELILEENLNSESYKLVSDKSPNIVFKFKIIEFINSIN